MSTHKFGYNGGSPWVRENQNSVFYLQKSPRNLTSPHRTLVRLVQKMRLDPRATRLWDQDVSLPAHRYCSDLPLDQADWFRRHPEHAAESTCALGTTQ